MAACTERTKAVMPVHYAGVACEMDVISDVAARAGLIVIEDAAHGIHAWRDGRHLGGLGHLGALSFHETKNVIAGEGGALLVQDERLIGRAEIIREKGTNRSSFFRGQVDKYTWVDIGSSYLPSEIIAAFLHAQLEAARELTDKRRRAWTRYHDAFADLEDAGVVRRPIVPPECGHNAHLYYLLLRTLEARTATLARMKERGVAALFHYVPLDSSPAGRKFARTSGDLAITHDLSDRLVRLPLWPNLSDAEVDAVIDVARDTIVAATR